MRTVLVAPADLDAAEVILDGEVHRHLFRSARQRVGDRVRLVDGQGRAVWGEILDVGRHRAVVGLGEAAPTHEPALRLDLRVAAPKGNRASWLVEKATEIGVDAVSFFRCGRGPRSYGRSTLQRLQRVARSAVEQSHRSHVPSVSGMLDFKRAMADLPAGAAFHLDPGAESGFPVVGGGPVIALVGPEGGFRPSELEALEGAGSVGVKMGPTVLRIETAAIAAAACLLSASGESWPDDL